MAKLSTKYKLSVNRWTAPAGVHRGNVGLCCFGYAPADKKCPGCSADKKAPPPVGGGAEGAAYQAFFAMMA